MNPVREHGHNCWEFFIVRLIFFSKFSFSRNSFRQVSNRLDPYQAGCFAGLDLVPNYSQRLKGRDNILIRDLKNVLYIFSVFSSDFSENRFRADLLGKLSQFFLMSSKYELRHVISNNVAF